MWRLNFDFRPFSWNAFQWAWLKKNARWGTRPWKCFCFSLISTVAGKVSRWAVFHDGSGVYYSLVIFFRSKIFRSRWEIFFRYWGWYLKSFGCILWRENEGFWMKGANLPGAFTEFFVFAHSVFFIISPSSYPPPSSNQTPAYNKFNTSHNFDF